MARRLAELEEAGTAGDIKPWAEYRHTQVEAEETEFGIRVFAVRPAGEGRLFVRISNFVLPNLDVTCVDNDGQLFIWHVPIDDLTHHKYMLMFSRAGAIGEEQRALYRAETAPDGRRRRNRANRYLQDRASMNDQWFAGMGPYFGVHDSFATESQGAIADRQREHLGPADVGLIAMRSRLLRAVTELAQGRAPSSISAFGPRVPTITTMLDSRGDWKSAARAAALELLAAA